MCGILIYTNPDDVNLDIMNHRGLLSKSTTHNGHTFDFRRLPINGISPPVVFPARDKKSFTWLVGEYYNFDRRKYKCDTQALHDIIGKQKLDTHINGMFHIIKSHSPNLIRIYSDFLGKKPLYYRFDIGAFCSEIKPLTKKSCTLNMNYIGAIEDKKLPKEGDTVYNEICQLIPGKNFSIYKKNGVSIYFQSQKPHITPVNLVEDLIQAIDIRFKADRDVALLCSGGLDSSIIYWIATHVLGLNPTVFHIANKESRYLEGLKIHKSKLVKVRIPEKTDLDKILYYNESPWDLGSMVPQYYLAKALNKAGYRVAVSGDGADEIFAGYKRAQKKDTWDYDIRELKMYHLPRLDKLMMAHTVELRCPYLDMNIFEYSKNLTYEERKNKEPLRKIAKQIGLPEEIINREKKTLILPRLVGKVKLEWQKYLIQRFTQIYSRGIVNEYN